VSILFRFHALRKLYLKESPGNAPRTPDNTGESEAGKLSQLSDSSNRLIDNITDQNCSPEVALQAINDLQAAPKVQGIFSRMGDFLKNSPEMKIYFFEQNRYSALQRDFFARYKSVLTREYQEALATGKNIEETKERLIQFLTGKFEPKAILDNLIPGGNYSEKSKASQKKQEDAKFSAQKKMEQEEKDKLEGLYRSSGGGGGYSPEQKSPKQPQPTATEKPQLEKLKLKSGASELFHSMRINPDKDPATAQKIIAKIEKIFSKTRDEFPESLAKIYENPSNYTDYFGNSQNVRAVLSSMLGHIRNLNIENINHSLFGGTESRLRPFKGYSLEDLLLKKPTEEMKKIPEFNNLKSYLKTVWKNYSNRII